MKKILVLGKNGMLGHVVYQYILENPITDYEVIGTTREDFDFTKLEDFDKFKKWVLLEKIDVIVNCIGVLINESNQSPDNAILVNSYLPHFLTRMCFESMGALKLIHITTDCVFEGLGFFDKKARYNFYDDSDSKSIYGRTKSLGDELGPYTKGFKETLPISILRTSIIGPNINGKISGLFDYLINDPKPNGYKNHIWTGTTTLHLAKFIRHLIDRRCFFLWRNFGAIHWGEQETNSKYEVLEKINGIFNLGKKINPVCTEDGQNKALIYEIDEYARRGIFLSLDEALKELKDWMLAHPNLYERGYKIVFDRKGGNC